MHRGRLGEQRRRHVGVAARRQHDGAPKRVGMRETPLRCCVDVRPCGRGMPSTTSRSGCPPTWASMVLRTRIICVAGGHPTLAPPEDRSSAATRLNSARICDSRRGVSFAVSRVCQRGDTTMGGRNWSRWLRRQPRARSWRLRRRLRTTVRSIVDTVKASSEAPTMRDAVVGSSSNRTTCIAMPIAATTAGTAGVTGIATISVEGTRPDIARVLQRPRRCHAGAPRRSRPGTTARLPGAGLRARLQRRVGAGSRRWPRPRPVRSPRHGDYRSADQGYNRSDGSKDSYKNNYRSGFRQGYEGGYRDATRGAYRR